MNSGLDDTEVLLKLDELMESLLPQALEKSMKDAVLFLEGESKRNCPAEKGTLRQSITNEVEIKPDGVYGYVGSNLDYAPYVHQGTGIFALEGNGREEVPWTFQDAEGNWITTYGIPATPFIQNAIDANRAAVIQYFEGALEDGK